MCKRPGKLIALAAIGLLLAAPAGAQSITVPNTFTNGTVADATQVNANFAALAANALNRAAGIFSGSATPASDNALDLGTNALRFANIRAVNFTGTGATFTGNGAALTTLNASNLASGTVATARLGSGSATSSTYLQGDSTWATINSVPTGAIFMFNTTSCPTGYAEFTAARGLYVVGLVSGGTLATAVGTPLTNLENRAVGQHGHAGSTVAITDPGHGHDLHTGSGGTTGAIAGANGATANGGDITGGPVKSNTTGITATPTIANSGSVAGTNAPYLELLLCQKS